MRTCEIDGCTKPHRARGLCATHYNQQHQPNRHRKTLLACDRCGETYTREDRSNRYAGTYCTWECRAEAMWGELRLSKQQVAIYKRPARVATHTHVGRKVWTAGNCKECGQSFIDTQPHITFCAPRCAKAWHRRAWKVRTNRIVPPDTRSHVYARDGGVCQICLDPIDMTLSGTHQHGPTLDHIICQSWTQEPDHSAENLRLSHRICNSIRSDEGRHNATQRARLEAA